MKRCNFKVRKMRGNTLGNFACGKKATVKSVDQYRCDEHTDSDFMRDAYTGTYTLRRI